VGGTLSERSVKMSWSSRWHQQLHSRLAAFCQVAEHAMNTLSDAVPQALSTQSKGLKRLKVVL